MVTQTGGHRRTRWPRVLALLFLVAPGPLAAQEYCRPESLIAAPHLSLLPPESRLSLRSCDGRESLLGDGQPAGCHRPALTPEVRYRLAAGGDASDGLGPEVEPKQPRRLAALLVSAGVVAGAAATGFTETPHQGFHFTQEGWFGRNTYAGGADKASHFVDYAIISKELAYLYGRLGYSPSQARWMAFGVMVAAGLMNETGDGISIYGFSYEDLLMDIFGAGTSSLLGALGAHDLVGFRHGFLLPPAGEPFCCPVQGVGRDYSNEIYTADLKIAGLARRLQVNAGLLRYLYLSLTYGVKGYPDGLPQFRERLVGIEVGLNFSEMLNDLGVQRNTWWGYGLHVVFDSVRFPFTAIGFRYNLNNNRWSGPNAGN